MLTLRRAKLHSDLTGAGRLTSPAPLSAHSCPSDVVPGVHSRRGGRQTARCMPSKQEHWSSVQEWAEGTHEASGAHSCSVSRLLQARASTCAAKQSTGALTGQGGCTLRTTGQQGPHCPVHDAALWVPTMPLPRGVAGGRSPVHPLAAQSPGQSLPWD